MKKIFIYLFVAAAMFWVSGCAGRQSIEMGPEQTVTAFNEAMAQGRFGDAAALCDTLLMDGYLKRYADRWDKAMKADSGTAAAASSLLSGISTDIVSVEKDGDDRVVCYTVGIPGLDEPGNSARKARKAIVRKEEGEWKIKSVTTEN